VQRAELTSSFQGFGPLDVFPTTESYFIPNEDPSSLVTLRPQGFAPSRRLAPPATCRAYFIPVPPLGLTLRGFAPPAAPYVLSDAATLYGVHERATERVVGPKTAHSNPRTPPPLQGLSTLRKSSPARWW